MEKINIAELLKDCPSGMELDCTMFIQPVTFDKVINYVNENYPIVIKTHNGSIMTLTKYGTYTDAMGDAKCVIYPKGKTTWEGFQRPFKDGDVVTWKDRGELVACIYKERQNTVSFYHHIALYKGNLGIVVDGEIVLTDDKLSFATEEEKQKLFDAIKENGYRWNNETKTLERLIEPKFKMGDKIKQIGSPRSYIIKTIEFDRYVLNNNQFIKFVDEHRYELVPNKFDITTLKPFDKVLTRTTNSDVWGADLFGCYKDGWFLCNGHIGFRQCIPYKENEHLLGTTNDCDEFYKTWK